MSETPQPQRMKYWSELDDKEKIERTREVIANLIRDVDRLKKDWRNMENHKHDKNGVPIVEQRLGWNYGECERSSQPRNDDVYF